MNGQSLRWPINGNLYVPLMLVLVGDFTNLRHNYVKTSTQLRQNLVDENPKLSKTPHGGLEEAPRGYFAGVGC